MKFFTTTLLCAICVFNTVAQNLPAEVQQQLSKIKKIQSQQPEQPTARSGAACLPDSVVSFLIDESSGDSTVNSKILYEYTQSGLQSKVTTYQIDPSTEELAVSSVISYAYNSQDVLIFESEQLANPGGGLEVNSSTYYFPKGNSTTVLDSSVYYTIDFGTGNFVRTTLTTFKVDAIDQIIGTVDYIYDSATGWILNGKSDYIYTIKSQPFQIITYTRIEPIWIEDTKFDFTYFTFDSVEQVVITNLKDSVLSARITYSYDLPERSSTQVFELWDKDMAQWNFFNRAKIDYDSEGLIEMTESFTDFSGLFSFGDQKFYNYPTTSDCVSFTDDFSTDDGLEWIPIGTTYYYYNGGIISTKSPIINELRVEVAPNPFSENFKIAAPEGSQIQVFSAAGKLMFEARARINLTEIDGANFPNGVYFISIKNAGQVVTKLATKMD